MGTLEYLASRYVADIDDRTLAHLQIVICNKLRRDERFTLTLSPTDGFGETETVLWFASALPVRFRYSSDMQPTINTAWLHVLADAAAGRTGLRILPEPERPTVPASDRAPRERVST